MFGFKKRRRARLRAEPFPLPWLLTIERDVPYYGRLSEADRIELQGHIQVFLAEKTFEGCGGLEMADDIRVIVAAQACVLLLHRDTDYFSKLDTVLVYPHAFLVERTERGPGRWVIKSEELRVGESWHQGVIILAWDDVEHSVINHSGGARAAGPHDGHNVVFHEFAHQLDRENGDTDGYPVLEDRALERAWPKVMQREFKRLEHDLECGRRTVIDPYGAENPAEFFAVVTECFFEIPARLKQHHPELYDIFSHYYQQDPASFGNDTETWFKNVYTDPVL